VTVTAGVGLCDLCAGRGRVAEGVACPVCRGTGVSSAADAEAWRQSVIDSAAEGIRRQLAAAGTAATSGWLREHAQSRDDARLAALRATEAADRAQAHAQAPHREAQAVLSEARAVLARAEAIAAAAAPAPLPAGAPAVIPPDPTDPPPGAPIPPGFGSGDLFYLDSLLVRQLDVWGALNTVGGGLMVNPMSTLGDLITGGTGGAAARLGIGGNGQVLTVSGGVPTWQNSAAGFANPMSTAGDLIAGGVAGAAGRLALGSAGQVLQVSFAGGLQWLKAQGVPVAGPSSSQPTVFQLPDASYMVIPLSTYSLGGDDATWINNAMARLVAPGTPGADTARLQNGSEYNIQSAVGGASWTYGTYLDLNGAQLNANMTVNGTACIQMTSSLGGSYPWGYGAGGAYNGVIVYGGAIGTPIGLRYGAGKNWNFRELVISGFKDGSAGGMGVYEDNTGGWTEKVRSQIEIWNCDTLFVFDSPGGTYTSHEYNEWNLILHCYRGQTAVKGLNNAYTSGSYLHLQMNMGVLFGSGTGGTAIDISDPTGPGNVRMSQTFIVVEAETTGTGAPTWQTVKFGTTGQMQNSMGMLRFNGGNWTASDVTAGKLSFGGMICEGGTTDTLGALNAVNTKPLGWL
jgi:hypothetical protein